MHVLHIGLDQKAIEYLLSHQIATHLVEEVEDTEELVEWTRSGYYDALVVDVTESGLGMFFPRVFRNKKMSLPIIGIVQRSPETSFIGQQADFIENGGDYLLEGPPNFRLLVASIRASVRRIQGSAAEILSFTLPGVTLKVDRLAFGASVNGSNVPLTGKEFQILSQLAATQGRVQTKESLLQALYAVGEDEPEIKIIDVFVCKLRKALSKTYPNAGDFIETVWGRGYRLRSSESDRATGSDSAPAKESA